MTRYVLDKENRPVLVADPTEWARWLEQANRSVDYTEITSKISVSTVFLGLDHRKGSNGPPILFETMIFGGKLDQSCWRYSSWDDAEAGHKAAVLRARAAQKTKA